MKALKVVMIVFIVLIPVLVDYLLLGFPEDDIFYDPGQLLIQTSKGMVFSEENLLDFNGFHKTSILSWNYDSPSMFFKEWESCFVQNSKISLYFVLSRQGVFSSLLLFLNYNYAPLLFYRTFMNQLEMSPLPTYGKTLLNTTEITVKYGNFDQKFKEIIIKIPEIGLDAEFEVFKKTSESLVNISPLSETKKNFEYSYFDSNKLVTGYISIRGSKVELKGANAIVEWTRAEHPYSSYRIWCAALGEHMAKPISLSLGKFLQNSFSKSTPDAIVYGKQVIKLGASQFVYTKWYYPFNITTVPYNSSKLFASFYPDNPYETFTNYFIAKSKQVIIPGTFVCKLESEFLNSTFELKGLLHVRSSFLLV